jgi:hypothetical protein
MSENFLKLNEDKTELILFGSHCSLHHTQEIKIAIGDICVSSTSSVRNLGAIFDNKLTMEKFINQKISTAIYYLRNISRIRRFLTPSATKLLVHAYVISRLDYSNSLLQGTSNTLLHKLQMVQNSAARLILQANRYDSATCLLKQLHWLPIKYRIQFKVLTHVFSCIHGHAPEYLSELITPYDCTRTLRSAEQHLLTEFRTTTKFGDRAFVNCAPKLWNSLPFHIKNTNSFSLFKKYLKTYFFELAFC